MSEAAERFWAKVSKAGPTPAHAPHLGSCWEWTGTKVHESGYGRFEIDGQITVAHRVAWRLAHGSFPARGVELDHQCHNKACVNLAHIRPGTRKHNNENQAGPRIDNTTGVHGVGWYPRYSKWRARVHHNGKSILVGYFDSIADAEAAVIAKRNELFTNNLIDRAAALAA